MPAARTPDDQAGAIVPLEQLRAACQRLADLVEPTIGMEPEPLRIALDDAILTLARELLAEHGKDAARAIFKAAMLATITALSEAEESDGRS